MTTVRNPHSNLFRSARQCLCVVNRNRTFISPFRPLRRTTRENFLLTITWTRLFRLYINTKCRLFWFFLLLLYSSRSIHKCRSEQFVSCFVVAVAVRLDRLSSLSFSSIFSFISRNQANEKKRKGNRSRSSRCSSSLFALTHERNSQIERSHSTGKTLVNFCRKHALSRSLPSLANPSEKQTIHTKSRCPKFVQGDQFFLFPLLSNLFFRLSVE